MLMGLVVVVVLLLCPLAVPALNVLYISVNDCGEPRNTRETPTATNIMTMAATIMCRDRKLVLLLLLLLPFCVGLVGVVASAAVEESACPAPPPPPLEDFFFPMRKDDRTRWV